jgi:hypothetical protein
MMVRQRTVTDGERGRDGRSLWTEMDVLAVLPELASALGVQAAHLGSWNADRHRCSG